MVSTAPSRLTLKGPDRVSNVTASNSGAISVSSTWPLAKVAWPQSGTSIDGVNQRSPNLAGSEVRSRNAVSA